MVADVVRDELLGGVEDSLALGLLAPKACVVSIDGLDWGASSLRPRFASSCLALKVRGLSEERRRMMPVSVSSQDTATTSRPRATLTTLSSSENTFGSSSASTCCLAHILVGTDVVVHEVGGGSERSTAEVARKLCGTHPMLPRLRKHRCGSMRRGLREERARVGMTVSITSATRSEACEAHHWKRRDSWQ